MTQPNLLELAKQEDATGLKSIDKWKMIMKAKYDRIKTLVEIQADFSDRVIPINAPGVVVECYDNPEGYTVDIAMKSEKLLGGFNYENVILSPAQFVVEYCLENS